MTDDQADLDIFDQLVEETGEGREPGQPELPQEPGWVEPDALPTVGL